MYYSFIRPSITMDSGHMTLSFRDVTGPKFTGPHHKHTYLKKMPIKSPENQ